MITILITGDNFAAVKPVRGVAEALGFTVLHAYSTENVTEDVLLNSVALVIASESSQPFDACEVCEMLRGDPSIAPDLGVLLMHSGNVSPQRYEKAGFSGKVSTGAPDAVWIEEIIRLVGDRVSG